MRTPLLLKVSRVLGIDPSLAGCGLCFVESGREVRTTRLPDDKSKPLPARLAALRDNVHAAISEWGADLVAMESEIWLADPTGSSIQSMVQGVLQVEIFERGRRFLSVNPSHVKKYVGAQKKDEILLQVYKKFRREFKDHNLADAYVIGMIGAAFLDYADNGRLWPELTKPQIEVLDKLREKGLIWEVKPVAPPKGKAKKLTSARL